MSMKKGRVSSEVKPMAEVLTSHFIASCQGEERKGRRNSGVERKAPGKGRGNVRHGLRWAVYNV